MVNHVPHGLHQSNTWFSNRDDTKNISRFYYHLLKVIFGAHLSNLRKDKLNYKKQTEFFTHKQTRIQFVKSQMKMIWPYRSGNRWYSYNKFSIVYQFHRLYENTTYYLTYNSTRDKSTLKFKGSAEGNFD